MLEAKAVFQIAYERTNALEGGLTDHELDRGGLTYRGISRRWHPDWSGWTYVDLEREQGMTYPVQLQVAHRRFYRTQYWDALELDELPAELQDIANEIYDSAVLAGRRTVSRWLQRALNTLNNQQQRWHDLRVDGQIGPQTRAALIAATDYRAEIITLLNAQLGTHLLDLVEGDHSQEVFMVGWLKRVQIVPKDAT